MVTPPAALSLAVLPPGVIWPLLIGALASLGACSATIAVVVAQRHSSRRRRGPSSTSKP